MVIYKGDDLFDPIDGGQFGLTWCGFSDHWECFQFERGDDNDHTETVDWAV